MSKDGSGEQLNKDSTIDDENQAEAKAEAEPSVSTDVKGFDRNATYHTGSFATCASSTSPDADADDDTPTAIITSSDRGTVTISCKQIPFRAPLTAFHNDQLQILVGVLSSAGGSGPARRQSIRSTWASTHTNNGVFFLVAGPWEDIQEEYHTYNDLLWIDEEEVYDGERSVLTYKTYAFIAIAHATATKYKYTYTHLFKTDDDSYADLNALRSELNYNVTPRKCSRYEDATCTHDFVGQCQLLHHRVHREEEYKWPLRESSYPEPWFPLYCQGAGFAISHKFASCIANHRHIDNIRFMPFEDVAVGMLAERCGIIPEWPSTGKVKVDRYKSEEARLRTRMGNKNVDDLIAPAACMKNTIVQHRIIDEDDMRDHHEAALDEAYCDITKERREEKVKKMEEKGLEWFD